MAVGAGATHEGMHDAAIGLDAGGSDTAVLIGNGAGLIGTLATVLDRLLPGRFRIVDGERDVLDAVAVTAEFLGSRVVLAQGRLQQKADVALREQVSAAIPGAGREIRPLGDGEAEVVGVEEGRLLGVSDEEPDVVHINQCKRIRRRLGRGGVRSRHVNTPKTSATPAPVSGGDAGR